MDKEQRFRDKRFRMGEVYASCTSPNGLYNTVCEAVNNSVNDYICVACMRSITLANQMSEYKDVINNSYLCSTDGMPLIWIAHAWGLKEAERACGPDLFVRILNEGQYKSFLLGDTEETLSAIQQKYPNSNIVGTYSPPFCKIDDFDYPGMADMVNKSGAQILWVGLGAPKQDLFCARVKPYLNNKLQIAVGAAFRCSIGGYQMPNKVAQKLGLTGLFWRKWSVKLLWDYVKATFEILGYCKDAYVGRIRRIKPWE